MIAAVVPLAAGVAWVTTWAAAPDPGVSREQVSEILARLDRIERAQRTGGVADARGLARRLDAIEAALRDRSTGTTESAGGRAPASDAGAGSAEAAAGAASQRDGAANAPDPGDRDAAGRPEQTAAAHEDLLTLLKARTGSSEHRDAVRRLAEYLVRSAGPAGDPKDVEWASEVMEMEARRDRVSPEDASDLAGMLSTLAVDHEARPALAAAAARGWSQDARVETFLAQFPANSEPKVHLRLLRSLDEAKRPARGYADYVVRFAREEQDESVLRSVVDEDRIYAASVQGAAQRLIDTIETRVLQDTWERKMRWTAAGALAVAGLHAREGGAAALERLATRETESAAAETIRTAARTLREGRGSEKEFERMFD